MFKAEKLALKRGNILVFRQLGFSLDAGETLVVSGRNGSGKSSLLRGIAGLLPFFEGALFWQGAKLRDFREQRLEVSYIGHENALKPELTLVQMLSYWRALQMTNVPWSSEHLELFGLKGKEDSLIGQLSAGQKRRISLLRLKLNPTPLWLMDEPLTALDTRGSQLVRDLVAIHAKNGGITVIATHQPIDGLACVELMLGGALL